jgi:hypothetical protein
MRTRGREIAGVLSDSAAARAQLVSLRHRQGAEYHSRSRDDEFVARRDTARHPDEGPAAGMIGEGRL